MVSHDLSNSLAISDIAFILSKEEGKEGATINHQVDLAAQGLAWQPDIKENPNFLGIVKTGKIIIMKPKNRKKRLEARIKDWDTIKADESKDSGKTKITQGSAFRKPGSNNK